MHVISVRIDLSLAAAPLDSGTGAAGQTFGINRSCLGPI